VFQVIDALLLQLLCGDAVELVQGVTVEIDQSIHRARI
jgi:hypothetical protein